MHSNKREISRLVVVVSVLLTCVTVPLRGQIDAMQWRIPWPASDKETLIVHADPRDDGGVLHHTLRVTNPAGTQLFSHEDRKLLQAAVLDVNWTTGESLFVTHWTGGVSTTRVIVLRKIANRVETVANLQIDSDYMSLLDVDGDIYQEIVGGEERQLKGHPHSDWPMDFVAYRWNGSALVRYGSVPASRLKPTLRQLFHSRPHSPLSPPAAHPTGR